MSRWPYVAGALLVVAAIAVGAILLGGDDESGGRATGRAPATKAAGEDAAADPRAAKDGSPRSGSGSGGAPEGSSGADAGADGDASESPDFEVDLESIPGARITPTGAVQTLPPSADDERTAQRNSYASIREFGEEAEGAEAAEITFALVQYLNAKVEGDWATACARLYSPLIPDLEELAAAGDPGDCAEAFARAMERVPAAVLAEQAKIDVSSVRRDEADRAFVIYKTPGTLSADMPLYLEDGVWKVAAIEAYALTPEQAG